MSYRAFKTKRTQETIKKRKKNQKKTYMLARSGLITLRSCLSDFLYCFCCFQAAVNFLNARTIFKLTFYASKLKILKCLMQDKCVDECLSVLDECLSVKP